MLLFQQHEQNVGYHRYVVATEKVLQDFYHFGRKWSRIVQSNFVIPRILARGNSFSRPEGLRSPAICGNDLYFLGLRDLSSVRVNRALFF